MTRTSAYEPRPTRFGISHPVMLVRADGSEFQATITNVSQDGFGLKVRNRLLVGENVLLRGELGDVPAQVRWAGDNGAGGVFLQG